MQDPHLEILLRVDERLAHLTKQFEVAEKSNSEGFERRRAEHLALSQRVAEQAHEIRLLVDQHAELKSLAKRVSELETFKRAALLIAGGVASLITLAINKIVSLWPWG